MTSIIHRLSLYVWPTAHTQYSCATVVYHDGHGSSPPSHLFEGGGGGSFGSTIASGYARVVQGDVNIGQLHIKIGDVISPAFHFMSSILKNVVKANQLAYLASERFWQSLGTFAISVTTILLIVQHPPLLRTNLSLATSFRKAPVTLAYVFSAPKLNPVLARHISRLARFARYRW